MIQKSSVIRKYTLFVNIKINHCMYFINISSHGENTTLSDLAQPLHGYCRKMLHIFHKILIYLALQNWCWHCKYLEKAVRRKFSQAIRLDPCYSGFFLSFFCILSGDFASASEKPWLFWLSVGYHGKSWKTLPAQFLKFSYGK